MAVCEMCGKDSQLKKADVEGVSLSVCSNCVKYGSVKKENKFVAKRSFSNGKPEFKVVEDFSVKLKSAREGRTQEEFAALLNERESVVAKWESGSLKPRVDVARRIGRTLGLNLVVKIGLPGKIELEKKRSSVMTLGDMIKIKRR